MPVKFKHTLSFVCPYCKAPVVATKVRAEKNLESVDSLSFKVRCLECTQESQLAGLSAKQHTVESYNENQ